MPILGVQVYENLFDFHSHFPGSFYFFLTLFSSVLYTVHLHKTILVVYIFKHISRSNDKYPLDKHFQTDFTYDLTPDTI